MYQKILLVLLTALFLLGAAGCQGNDAPTAPNSEAQESAIHIEPTETGHDHREVLALVDFRNNPVFHDFEEGSLLNTADIDLPHTALEERTESFYNGEKELDSLVQYAKDSLQVEINNRWKVFIHYYDTDKTVGMVQFIYTVGEISTNRSILFNINENKYDTVYYKCLTGDIDETDLTVRIRLFQSKYIQEKRELREGETFCEEKTAFTYFIHTGTLVYSYAYFFQYDIGVINNDWGTERIIDKNGYAFALFSFATDKQNYPHGEPGVKTDGFLNIAPCPLSDCEDAIAQAKKECTVTYDTVSLSYDFAEDIWRVCFYTFDLVGGCQSVYLDSNGITQLIVYGD